MKCTKLHATGTLRSRENQAFVGRNHLNHICKRCCPVGQRISIIADQLKAFRGGGFYMINISVTESRYECEIKPPVYKHATIGNTVFGVT